jgi:uncharacterized protein involved in tolerance to divalent cations
MSKLTLFTSLKTDLEAISGIKKVFLWNNQLERESEENAFLYPSIGIEFLPSTYRDKGKLASSQEYDLTVRLHILFESYLDEDATILTLTDTVWQTVHTARYGTFGKLLRRNEEQSFDHPNVQDYIQDYATLGNDNLTTDTTTGTLTPVINATINTPDELT